MVNSRLGKCFCRRLDIGRNVPSVRLPEKTAPATGMALATPLANSFLVIITPRGDVATMQAVVTGIVQVAQISPLADLGNLTRVIEAMDDPEAVFEL